MDSSKLAEQSPADLASKPLAERERALWIASGEYMRGNLTKEQLEDKERLYAPDLYSFDSPPPQAAQELSLWDRCKEAILEIINR